MEYVFSFLVLLTPVVFIHELGHYWVARKSGVAVEVFSVGFGPEWFARVDKHGTRWRLGLLPFGGYVKMRGDENAASMPGVESRRLPGSFYFASVWARMAIVGAGPAANFIFGMVLFAGIYMVVGKSFVPPVIGQVIEGSAAHEAGLEAGDRILVVEGFEIDDFNTIRTIVFESPDRELLFEIDRFGSHKALTVTPRMVYSDELKVEFGQLGITSIGGEHRRLGPSESIIQASSDAIQMSQAMLRALTRIFTLNASVGEFGGPVRIAEFSAEAASQGVVGFLLLMAIISINLGMINLVPIPGLDGGHLLFFIIEAVKGKPLSEFMQSILIRGGISLLIGIMLGVTVNDIVSQISG